MTQEKILQMVDHTVLSPTATWHEIQEACDDAIKYQTASVCIPPCYVKRAKAYVGDKCKICTVVGFPNGSNSVLTKCYEAMDAVKHGADEIDMVINLAMLKAKSYDYLALEIQSVKEACRGHILKVIIETCLLTEEEKIKMCEIVTKVKADYIKTSTGFSTGGATFEDIELFAKHIRKNVKIKASGGISSMEDAEKFIALGASRLGTSRLVKILKNEEKL